MDQDIREIELEHINEPPHAMRTEISRDEVFELATDIKKNGLINPITVRPVGEKFEVVAGHRRFLAHRYGGMLKIRCIVRTLTDEEVFAIMTSENLKREDVNPVDEAIHVSRLLNINGQDVHKVAEIVGRSASWVETRELIYRMPDTLKSALREGKVKLGVATALMDIADEVDRDTCLQMAISQGASVVVAQYWVAQWKAGLFGRATGNLEMGDDLPNGGRSVVMLRCMIDGKKYPATDFTTFLVAKKNAGYVEALAELMQNEAKATELPPVETEEEAVLET